MEKLGLRSWLYGLAGGTEDKTFYGLCYGAETKLNLVQSFPEYCTHILPHDSEVLQGQHFKHSNIRGIT